MSDEQRDISSIVSSNTRCGEVDGKSDRVVCCNEVKGRFVILMADTGNLKRSLHVGWVDVKVIIYIIVKSRKTLRLFRLVHQDVAMIHQLRRYAMS